MPMKINQREYRVLMDLSPMTDQTNRRIDSEFYVEGYATTWEPYVLMEYDGVKYYEKISPEAFRDADLSDVIMQYDHSGKVFARMSNGTLIVEPDGSGLFMCADLSKSEGAKELYREIQEGLITKMSWAFTVADESFDRETRTRSINKVKKVFDVSAVSIPANDGTQISARSFVDGVITKEQEEILERERQLAIFNFRRRK